jgi:hypothetical protein
LPLDTFEVQFVLVWHFKFSLNHFARRDPSQVMGEG